MNTNGLYFSIDTRLAKSGDPKRGVKIRGLSTATTKDIDGENVNYVDWGPFLKNGMIKWEHDEIKGPDAYCGVPTKVFKKGNKTYFEGNLFPYDPNVPDEKLGPQEKLAKSAHKFLEMIEKHNALHPNNPRKIGISLEGGYLPGSTKDNVKALVVDIVMTTKPRHPMTYVELAKSLTVGHGTSPDTQTGFGATRKESIIGGIKDQVFHKYNKGAKKKMTKMDFYFKHKQAGMTDEDAAKKAEEDYEGQQTSLKKSFETSQVALSGSREKLSEAITGLEEVSSSEIEFDTETHRKSLKKSISFEDPEQADPTEFLNQVANGQIAIVQGITAMNNNLTKLAKSISTFVGAQGDQLTVSEFVQDTTNMTQAGIDSMRTDLAKLTNILANATPNFSGNLKKSLETADFSKGGEEIVRLTKSQELEVLGELEKSGEVEKGVVSLYNTAGYIEPEHAQLVMKKAKEILKL